MSSKQKKNGTCTFCGTNKQFLCSSSVTCIKTNVLTQLQHSLRGRQKTKLLIWRSVWIQILTYANFPVSWAVWRTSLLQILNVWWRLNIHTPTSSRGIINSDEKVGKKQKWFMLYNVKWLWTTTDVLLQLLRFSLWNIDKDSLTQDMTHCQ